MPDAAGRRHEGALRAALMRSGIASAPELTAALGISQPTLSRALAALRGEVLVLGAARATRYAWPRTILGRPAQQPLHWVHEDGRIERWGTLTFIEGGRLHLEAPGFESLTQGALPWVLSPLRGEGYLGRLQAQVLAPLGLDTDPARWPLEHQLFAGMQAGDAPGAIVIGEPTTAALPVIGGAQDLDAIADQLTRGQLPAGSSAGGEQPKFLARRPDGQPVLVKFTPPRASAGAPWRNPAATRWTDLLHSEALALQVLGEHGVPVAQAEVVDTPTRTHLVSTRFDRIGALGRRHVVPLHAVHDAFVRGPREHWAGTVEALVAQRRLPPEAAAQVDALRRFGRLIGNSDMHFGNLSLRVEPGQVAAGRFTLAPLYDMLPMRWRPDPQHGDSEPSPFTPEPIDLQSAARPLAAEFWRRVAASQAVSREWRALAAAMQQRLS